ncbi:MAG: phosphoribosylformylglycinamidine synthase I [Candidatus Omnitrophica bacterium CG08_land_8_20_14_0_20_41_16]|uniref:Phosphoribosylformylglycinamidine synthase subunit PurQ n=1 Tax=Candidatus Sherwoodlollariibacterium unditelluris TaxID=1974757 RepID=A0A2G9YMK0_9BACT|nr:MAG: phosphoribosylformylglycinamidine synthase I [Candidatus Omnitrophica bacterium CG23_combo_of_CG06-09_8_20_14_all_41_10]PIS33959.1 MAG: phosphoribosylformylglycinamidine synthase I [Candidatus Omnitrophica bacterium CG08_land_8_20_14_0_20_41_16]
MKKIKVCVLRTAGTNCDKETAFAFSLVGASAELVHINNLASAKVNLSNYHILALPGGFSYGDDIASGKIFANELKYKLSADLKKFIQEGKLIIGICNGFQILVKSGLLPGNDSLIQEASLIINDSGKFEDRWVYLSSRVREFASSRVKCIWTKNLPEIIYLPVAHGEGKFIVKDKKVLSRIKKNGQVVFSYCDALGRLTGWPANPNGSLQNIAGIYDTTGRILGLMPHPERHIQLWQHPRWEDSKPRTTGLQVRGKSGVGLQIFKNGVDYIKKHF